MKGLEGGLRARAGHIGREAAEVDLDLVPGVRDRLHARLVAMGIPATKEVSYVAGITQRAAQSVRRWFDAREPGLPDLESFARLCIGLGCSADEIIGALHREGHNPARCAHMVQMANCIRAITDSLPILKAADSVAVKKPNATPHRMMSTVRIAGMLCPMIFRVCRKNTLSPMG